MKRNGTILLTIAIGVAILVSGAFILTAPVRREAKQQHTAFNAVYQEYSTAIEAHEFGKAYSLTDQEFRKVLSESAFEAEQKSLEGEWGPLMSSKVEGLEMTGHGSPMRWVSKLREKRSYQKKELYLKYEFRLENGRWFLYGYQEDK